MKKFFNLKKWLSFTAFTFAFIVSSAINTFAITGLYDQISSEIVSKGVQYEKNHRLTDEGWLDIHTLRIDLTADNIKLEPIENWNDYGKKETVLNLVNNVGALAGVNADFFGMKGNYSASFGLVMKDGNLVSAGTDKNTEYGEYSTFFLDKENNPFISYLKFNIEFFNDGNAHIELASANKITQMIYPIYFDRNVAENTSLLDARFPGLVKLVIEDGMITYISLKGETVNVPENGYLIILSSEHFDSAQGVFAVGQTAEIKISASVDLDKIQTAISGAGRILVDGEKPDYEGLIIKGRQPRTALGISQDQKTLLLTVVDGRGTSIGATQDEMVYIMKELGAYNAMHFDGGGSSTMVVKAADEDSVSVINNVSDGAQRRVINAFGIVDTAPVSEINQLVIRPTQERIFISNNVAIELFGYDEYFHKLGVPLEQVNFSSDGGTFNGNIFTPSVTGKITINADYNGINAVSEVKAMEMASITPNIKTLNLEQGQSAEIYVSGVSTDGYTAPVSNGIVFEVSDPNLGYFEGNKFIALNNGSGYIKCSFGNASCYIGVGIGGNTNIVTSFEDINELEFSSYPNTVNGAAVVDASVVNDGLKSIALYYGMQESDSTQAAYLDFKSPINIAQRASSLKLMVYGNKSGDWLRGKIIDADGKEFVVDFSKNVDWEGWQDTMAQIPQEAKFPINLKTLYAASLKNSILGEKRLYCDNLRAVYPFDSTQVPADTGIIDTNYLDFQGKEEGSYYINMVGTVSSGVVKDLPLYETERINVNNKLQNNSDVMVYAGKNDIAAYSAVDTIKWSNTYNIYNKENVSIVQLTASNGGLRSTQPNQWLWFKNDVLSSTNNNIIFMIDKMPSAFSDPLENELFEDVLSEFADAGKNVFVVSSSGISSWSEIKEGIRYINLADLWTKDGNLNSNFKMLKFKVTGNDIVYKFENIY